MCPAWNAAGHLPQARMGCADQVQYSPARSRRSLWIWFSRPRLIDCCAILSFRPSYAADGLAVAADYAAAAGAR